MQTQCTLIPNQGNDNPTSSSKKARRVKQGIVTDIIATYIDNKL